MATRDEVVAFLNLFKGCLMLDRVSVKPRNKNRRGLVDLGITPDQRRETLMELLPEDYVDGPKPDDTDSLHKEVWEFGKHVRGQPTYIKLRVVQAPGKQGIYYGLIWSFHPAEYPLKHPLRRSEK